MNQRLRWRMRLYRMGRSYERWLKVAMVAGFIGLPLTVGLRSLWPQAGPGWQLLAMGASLLLAGIGHALLGEGSSVEAYAKGETEEMPALAKLASGLLASCGGVVIALAGLAQMVG